ncbi:MAG: hypothetical protein FWH24_06505, partial [Oscillospiraceae bacterium]|nr:hypothetical protein [Oscillospiraceae bacterium]
MKKTKKMLSLAVSLVLLMQLLIIPSALPISADTAAPGAFREDFTQIASLDDSNWLRQIGEASFGASSQIIDDAGGKVLHVNAYNDHAPGSAPAWGTPGWDEWGEVNLRFGTRNETPDNFKLEYRFKVANTGGHPHLLNWLAAPSGWEGGQIFGYYAGADPNYYLRSAYDVQPEQLRVNANLGNGWNTVIITYYNGVYTMYMNGVEAGSREFGARPNKYLHFKINALDFYLDYVEVSAYDGGGIITGPSAGTFREDFSNGNYPGEHLVTAGTAYGAAASVVDDADVGKALFANTYEPDSGAGTPWFEKNLVFALKEATPKNFKAEVRFKIGDTGGWPQMLICPAGTESGPLFNYRQMDGGFYYFGPQYDTIQNRKDENLKDGGWHTMTITVYEGLYILYINGAEKGRQTNTTLPPGRMTIKASTMDVWFDYVEITDFDGGSPFTNRAVFEDDFSAGTINTDNWGGSYLAGITGSPSGDGNALKLSLSPDLYTVANIATNNITPDDYVLRMKFLMETPYAPGGGGNRFPHFAVTMAGTGIDDNSVRFQNDYGWNYIKFGPDQGPPCLPLNEWHELIIIVNKGSYALYINNEKKGEFTSQRGAGDVLMFAMDMDVYIDKFSIEEYQGNPFSDAFGVSFADKPGHIFHTEEEIKFTLEYYNETNAAVNFDVSYEVKDYKGVIVQNGSLSGLTAPVLGKYSSDVALNIDSMGIFTLTATAETNDEVITKSIEFSRVFPVISNRDDTIFASCAHYGQGKGDLVISPYLQSLGGLSLIRDDCAWAAAEPRNGGGVITIPKSWDDFVDAVFDAGIEPLLIFAYGHQAYDGGGIPYTEAGRAGFVNFATKLVEHFSDTTRRADGKTVRYYEVWNEPNLFNTSFNPTNRSATDYTKLMIETYNAVKKVDPDVMI